MTPDHAHEAAQKIEHDCIEVFCSEFQGFNRDQAAAIIRSAIDAATKEIREERDYLKNYVVPEKDKHGKYWHDLAQTRIADLAAARELLEAKGIEV